MSAASEAPLGILKALGDAFNQGDPDAFVACLHPEVEWLEPNDVMPDLRGTYRGRSEVRGWLVEFLDAWESFHSTTEEVIEAGDGRILIGTNVRLIGRGSGVETDARFWTVLSLLDGLIKRREPFLDRTEALEAAGLSE